MANNYQITTHRDTLDTEGKRILRQKISEILTPELQNECPGLAIMVLTLDEYEMFMSSLKNEAIRKRSFDSYKRIPINNP